MKYYPINVKLEKKKCLIVGGGKVAERKVLNLLKCKTMIRVISPSLTKKLNALYKAGKIKYTCRKFKNADLKNIFLVIAATNNNIINKEIFRQASKANILVNVVDVPKLCNFIVPAVVKCGDLTIGISTSGRFPALAKKIKEEISKRYSKSDVEFFKKMYKIRSKITKTVSDQEKRSKVLNKIADLKAFDLFKKGKKRQANQLIDEIIKEAKI